MKAILVVDDMPNKCELCYLNYGGWCMLVREFLQKSVMKDGKAMFCPLKPMPQPKKITLEWLECEYENGWNDCLEEIENG